MFEVIGNIIVMVVFGLLVGTLFQVMTIFERPRKDSETKREAGESFLRYLRRTIREARERDPMENVIKKYRKAAYITMAMVYIVIALMVLLVVFSPIKMNWLAFILSIFAAFGILKLIFDRAKAGKISVKNRFFDIPSDQELIELSDPKSATDYYYRSRQYSNKGQHDLAIADLNKAIELDPKYTYAYELRAAVYIESGNYDLAFADNNKAIELDPKSAIAYNNRAICYREKEQYDLAIADLNKAIELDPKDAHPYMNRGAVYAEREQYDLAITDLNKAIELNPKYAKAYRLRAVAYANSGNYDLAIADYSKTIELDPKDAWIHYERGLAYKQKGKKDEAIADFEKSITITGDPQFREAKQQIEELNG